MVLYHWFKYDVLVPGNGRRHGKNHRDELALAAADWVIEHELSDLSLRRLAAGLGLSHRTLLYHFGSKHELFQAILRAARGRQRHRAVAPPDHSGEPEGATDVLRRAWRDQSAPGEHAFWRFAFEVHALALQHPDRYPEEREGRDWLELATAALTRDGVDQQQAEAIATLITAAFRGLMLDLLQTGERDRVDAGFEVLASVVNDATTSGDHKRPTNRPQTTRSSSAP